MVSSEIKLGTGDTLLVRDAFFNPRLVRDKGIAPILSGVAHNVMQNIDTKVIDDLRSFLFGPPDPAKKTLLDLVALNIQRGRDHGLPDYNQCRKDFGLSAVTSFSDITSDRDLQHKLEDVYDVVNSIDPWVGALAEDHLHGANVGELISKVLVDQFERLRDGDRFWYENDSALSHREKEEISKTRLSDIIKRNTGIEIQDNVFVVEKYSEPTVVSGRKNKIKKVAATP